MTFERPFQPKLFYNSMIHSVMIQTMFLLCVQATFSLEVQAILDKS